METFDNNHMEDGGDYTEAEQRLDFLQVRKGNFNKFLINIHLHIFNAWKRMASPVAFASTVKITVEKKGCT
jgi:hypothetical protein